MTGWAGWLMSGKAGCQCEPVIEGGCEVPPMDSLYALTAVEQYMLLTRSPSNHHLLLQTSVLYISLSVQLQRHKAVHLQVKLQNKRTRDPKLLCILLYYVQFRTECINSVCLSDVR